MAKKKRDFTLCWNWMSSSVLWYPLDPTSRTRLKGVKLSALTALDKMGSDSLTSLTFLRSIIWREILQNFWWVWEATVGEHTATPNRVEQGTIKEILLLKQLSCNQYRIYPITAENSNIYRTSLISSQYLLACFLFYRLKLQCSWMAPG